MKLYKEGYRQLGCHIASTVLFGFSGQWVSYFLIWLIACPGYGQAAPKQAITEADYHLWGTLSADKISDQGKWISYYMRYEERGEDTLFVKRSDGRKTYAFPKSGSGIFCSERQFACLKNDGTLQLLDLEKGLVTDIAEVEKYSFSANGKYLITLEGKADQKKTCIRNTKGQVVESVSGAGEYAQNKEGTAILCTYSIAEKNGILWVGLGTAVQKNKIVEDAVAAFSQLAWQPYGEGFTALESKKGAKEASLFYYALKGKKAYYLDPSQFKAFPSDYFIENGYASRLTVASDGRKVFFLIRKKPAFAKSFNGPQQWNGRDAVLYPERQLVVDSEFNTSIMAWWPQSGKLVSVTNADTPFGFLNGNQDFAITYRQDDLKPQYTMDRNVNYFITDLETGQKDLLLQNQSAAVEASSFSPHGNYFAYTKENNWWVYNFRTRKHTNVTAGKSLQLSNSEDKTLKFMYNLAGWGENEESLLIRDPFDIWKINLNNGNIQRLTKGRETGMSYAMVPSPYYTPFPTPFSGQVDELVDTTHDIILSGKKGTATGYFILKPDGSLKTIVFGEYNATEIRKTAQADTYLLQKAQYNHPPELVISKASNGTAASVFQSNPQHYHYAWGEQELIHYSNSKNVPLQGILYYPAHYNPQQKYPMVVHIYEKQLYHFNDYYNPSVNNMSGFNVANLTAQGYFVLLPDIEYELGNPGLSAVDCVVAATKEVIRKGIIDSNKIGLIGHSFGGYETNFIIGQTNLFACAISGASVADLTGWYLSIDWLAGRPEIWRFETQQWRMGKSLFEDMKGYERNSPITYADKIQTPVLIWAGEQDRQIHYYQSIAFYLALRRLQKKEIMLIYPGEGHALLDDENQKDLAHKMEDWLGFYLKGEEPKRWITEGIQ